MKVGTADGLRLAAEFGTALMRPAERGFGIEMLQVRETDVAGDDAAEVESSHATAKGRAGRLTEIDAAGIPVSGTTSPSLGSHLHVAHAPIRHALQVAAAVIVLDASSPGRFVYPVASTEVTELTAHVPYAVLVIKVREHRPGAGHAERSAPPSSPDGPASV